MLENSVLKTIESGRMTRDLAALVEGLPMMLVKREKYLSTLEFLNAVEARFLNDI